MNLHATRVLDTVDQMLLEAGQQDATDLRAALISMGSLADMPVPAPGARLAELLAGAPVHTTRREAMAREASAREAIAREGARFRSDELARRRALHRNRSAVVGLTVMAGMGLGVTGVAASLPQATENNSSVQQLLQDWAPRWTITEPTANAGHTEPTHVPVQATAEAETVPPTAAAEESAVAQQPGHSAAAGKGKSQSTAKATPTDAEDEQAGEAGKGAGAGKEQADEPELGVLSERQSVKPGSGASQKASPGARWLKKFNQ